MCFLLFKGVEEDDLGFAGITINNKGAKSYDVFVCVENRMLVFDSELGREDVKFNTYDDLLDAIVKLGKRIYAIDMVEKLSNAELELMRNERYPVLMTDGKEIAQLITSIRRIRDDYAGYNFTLVIKLGYLDDAYLNAILNDQVSIKYAIDRAKEHAKEICYKSDDDDVRYWCDGYDPLVHAEVYAIPEEKRIVITFYVEDVGEVYRSVKGYGTAEEFLKALEDFSGIAGLNE